MIYNFLLAVLLEQWEMGSHKWISLGPRIS